ncbi:MAG TPA: ABC transporter ATP-binding protein [Gemmatimonadaceae bacterium]|nr:ABC transporter ATP-binding protein [Gemmatimonadaceae bacterium]
MLEEDVLGKAYDARLMRRLLVYVRPYGGLVGASLALLFVDGLLQLVGPVLTQRVIDVALPARDLAMVRAAALLFAATLAAQFACSFGEAMLTGLLGQRVMLDLRVQIYAHLQRLSVSFFDRNPVGRLITRVTSDVESLNELFTAGVVAGLGDLFTLVAISVMMLVVDWRLALAAFAVIPLVWLTSHVFQSRVRDSYRDIRARVARINAFLQERLTGVRIVQLFGRERAEARRFDRLNRGHLDAQLRSITIYALYFPAIEFLTTLALASLIVTGASRVTAGTLTVGTVAAFLQLVRRFFQPLQDLSDKYNTLQQAMASSERIFKLLDTEPSVRDWAIGTRPSGLGARHDLGRPELPGAVPTAESRWPSAEPRKGVTVEFHDVWFAYDAPHAGRAAEGNGDGAGAAAEPEWVLRGVSFRASPGETMALVGHTGAGKTTVISLLMRFYDPQRGRITVDGVDVREMPLAELRGLTGYVQQDIFLFAGDVASNIRLSSPLSDEEVAAAAARVGADRVVRRLPTGYAHQLGERGASVSVGERQLLSFARAIAADPALLLLDEATSAVDSEVEAEIQRGLSVLMEGRTTIAVAHRLSTIVGADQILVMHHGQIVERGTHRELLAREGLYQRLYRLQVMGVAGAGRD